MSFCALAEKALAANRYKNMEVSPQAILGLLDERDWPKRKEFVFKEHYPRQYAEAVLTALHKREMEQSTTGAG